MVKPSPTWKPTLRLTIGAVMCALIAAMGVLVLTMTHMSSRRTLLTFSDELMTQVASTVRGQIRAFLYPLKQTIELTQALARSGVIDPDSVEDFEAYAFDTLGSHPNLTALYYGDEAGDFILVRRWPDGSLVTKIVRHTNPDGASLSAPRTTWRHRAPGASREDYRVADDSEDLYDPRTRPWYAYWTSTGPGERVDRPEPRYLTEGERFHVTDVYVFHTGQEPGTTLSLPLVGRDGRLRGVFGADIALMEISHFLAGLKIAQRGKAFVLDTRGRLIAVPDIDDLLILEKTPEGVARPALRSIDASTYSELLTLCRHERFANAQKTMDRHAFSFPHGDERYLASLEPVVPEIEDDWRVGVVVPENDFLGHVKRTMLLTACGIVGAIVVAFLVALSVSHLVARSMRKLVRESAKIRDLEFAPGSADSPFKEVYDVLTAFERMKAGLRSFGKYVPSKLVRLLLARRIEPAYGGEERELTIFFSDIREFTPLCETMDSDELAEKLGAYLSAITDCVQAPESQGIVDKYIGDSVMAFWGAPEAVERHAHKACRAALASLEAVARLREADPSLPDFRTGISIHTGQAVVGNFGSNERLNYTCIGDGVNLASRLEGLNKVYGTQIVVSQTTFERVQNDFDTRRLDIVAVKGKSRGVGVYELLGLSGEVDAQTLDAARAYEQGFDDYLARRWDEAIKGFSHAGRLRPGDLAAEVMIARCRRYALETPPPDWQGVHALDSK